MGDLVDDVVLIAPCEALGQTQLVAMRRDLTLEIRNHRPILGRAPSSGVAPATNTG
jgi:hypothetical protein